MAAPLRFQVALLTLSPGWPMSYVCSALLLMADVSRCMTCQFVHPSVHGQPGLLAAFGIIINRLRTLLYESSCGWMFWFFWGKVPKSAVAECQTSSQVAGPRGPPPTLSEGSSRPPASAVFRTVTPFNGSHSGECRVSLTRTFTCSSR